MASDEKDLGGHPEEGARMDGADGARDGHAGTAPARQRRRASAARARMVSPSWTSRGVVVRAPEPLAADSYAARDRQAAAADPVEEKESRPLSEDEWVEEGEGFYIPSAPEGGPAAKRHPARDARSERRKERRARRASSRPDRRAAKAGAQAAKAASKPEGAQDAKVATGGAPARRNEDDATPLAPHHRRRLFLIGAAAIVAVGVAAGGVYAYTHPAQPQVAAEDSDASQEDPLPDAKATLADYSWPELSRISEEISSQPDASSALEVAERFNICDAQGGIIDQTKDVQLSDGTVLPMRVAGIYHDDKADGTGKAGLTFISSDAALRRAMDDSGYEDGWEGTQMRSWLNSNILSEFPDDLQSRVISVNKVTNNVGVASDPSVVSATSDRLWLPSLVELCGPLSWHVDWKSVLDAEGTQYEWFSQRGAKSYDSNDALQMQGSDGSPTSWWTRSVSPTGYSYRTIDEDGNPVGYATLPEQLGVVVGFCL